MTDANSDDKQFLTFIVEDTQEMADLIADVLTGMGINTYHIPDGREALKFFERLTPDLLILDIGLPGMNGWELMKQIEEHHPDVMFPVIVLTAYDDAKHRLIGKLHKHVFHFMNKPFQPSQFRTVVKAALEIEN